MDAALTSKITEWAKDLNQVFTLQDLRVLFSDRTEAALYKRLNSLTQSEVLTKVKRGIYATPNATLQSISNRIDPTAYISTGTVLAKSALIGSVPVRKLQAVKTGRPRTFTCNLGMIEHLSIDPRLYFGFNSIDGIRYATPEKAFLDVCYYSYRGKRFSFDPATDINTQDLSQSILSDYLKLYDQRFIDYYNRIWGTA